MRVIYNPKNFKLGALKSVTRILEIRMLNLYITVIKIFEIRTLNL